MELITIVCATHFIPSAPDTRFLEKTINGISSELDGSDCLIGYDIPYPTEPKHIQYKTNIENIKTNHKITVYTKPNAGQRANFVNVIQQVKTPYFLFMENDWLFLEHPSFNKLINLLENHKDISTIYFNKRNNTIHKNELFLKPIAIDGIDLLKTSKWSNNPYLGRTEKWLNEWIPILNSAPLDPNEKTVQIENILHRMYLNEINENGFEKAHSKWGTYSYGKFGKNKMVLHLDASYRIDPKEICEARL